MAHSSSDEDSFLTAKSSSETSFESVSDDAQSLGDLVKNTFAQYSKTFNICHINAQSIPSHLSDLSETFGSGCVDAILVSESFLKPSLPSSFFPLPGYVLVRNDRVGKGGGGVAIYLRSHFPHKILCQSPSLYSASPEYLFLEINIGVKILLGVVYCPPTIDYFTKFESVLEDLTSDYTHTLILGDLNTCLLKTDLRSKKLTTIIESVNLNIINSLPTHHTSASDTLLDLIITSVADRIVCHGQLTAPAFSHHDLLFLAYKIRPPKSKPPVIKLRNFARMDTTKLTDEAAALGWIEVCELTNITEKVALLNSNIIDLFDRHAPVHSVKIKRPSSPWISDAIRKAMAGRDRAFRKYKHDRSDDNWASYKWLRNRSNLLVRNAKKRHIAEQIELASPAGIWRFLRTLGIGKQCVATSLPINLNILNIHFTTRCKLNPYTKSVALSEISCLPIPNTLPFSFTVVSEDRIKKILLSFKSNAVGSDNVGRIMISYIIQQILPAITHIVNFSLSSSQFPDQWRTAYVIPLPKISNPMVLSQFRPISILPFFSKIVESVVHSQVTQFLSDNNLFNPFQSGFRKGHSTTSALLNVTEDIRANMQDSKVTILVLIDFSSAFDAVDHDLLLALLPRLNFSPSTVSWFSSYLNNRRQRVRHGENFSEWREIEAGVPQGGILSPLLFSLFIDVLSRNLLSQYHMYADDLQLYCSAAPDNLSNATQILNNDLCQLLSWSTRYGIKVNPSKCQAIVIGSSRQLCKVEASNFPKLYYDGSLIPLSSTVKNLGVLFDSNLSWVPHIKEVSRRFYATLHSILRLKNFLPISSKISLANSLLIPILDYADAAFLDLTEELLSKLDRLLNTCIRFIYNLRKFDHVSEYRAKLKWLPIRERRNLRTLCLLFSVLKDPHTPGYLKNRFQFLSDAHDRQLRSADNLCLFTPLHHTSFMSNSFSVVAVRLWNELPLTIKQTDSKDSFKRLVKEHFLNKLS